MKQKVSDRHKFLNERRVEFWKCSNNDALSYDEILTANMEVDLPDFKAENEFMVFETIAKRLEEIYEEHKMMMRVSKLFAKPSAHTRRNIAEVMERAGLQPAFDKWNLRPTQ